MVPNENSSYIRLTGVKPDPIAIKLLPEDIARQYHIVPLWLANNELFIASTNASNQIHIKEISRVCKRAIHLLQASYSEIRAALDSFYRKQTTDPPRIDILEILYQLGHISDLDIQALRSIQAELRETLSAIRQSQVVDENKLIEAVALCYNLPHVRLKDCNPPSELAILIPWETARDRRVLPLWWLESVLLVGTPDPETVDYSNELTELVSLPVQLVLCAEVEWNRLYRQMYMHGSNVAQVEMEVAEFLVRQGKLSNQDFEVVRTLSKQNAQSIEEILVTKDIITSDDWMKALSKLFAIPIESSKIGGENTIIARRELERLVPAALAKKLFITPLRFENQKLILGMRSPDPKVKRLVEDLTGYQVLPRLINSSHFDHQIETLYESKSQHDTVTLPRLGKLLLILGVITSRQLKEALSGVLDSTRPIGEQLIQLGYLDDIDLGEALSLQTGIPFSRLEHARFESETIKQLPRELAFQHRMLPMFATDRDIWLAIADPMNTQGIIAAEAATSKRAWPVIVPGGAIDAALERLLGETAQSISPKAQEIVNQLVERGYLNHIEASTALTNYLYKRIPLDLAITQESQFGEHELAHVLAEITGLPIIDLHLIEEKSQVIDPIGQLVERTKSHDPVEEITANLINIEIARTLSAIPVKFKGSRLVVAFGDPLYETALIQLENLLHRKIIPGFAQRSQLEDAIQRNLGRRNIGNYLLLEGLISRGNLNDALELARRTGVRLGQALLNRGYITQAQLARTLAEQAAMPFYELKTAEIDETLVRQIDPQTARSLGILPLHGDEHHVTLAMVDPLNESGVKLAEQTLQRKISPVLVTEADMDWALERVFSRDYLAQSISELLEREPNDSAYQVLSKGQKITFTLFLIITIIWLILDHSSYLIIFNAVSTLFYISFSAYKFYLVYHALSRRLEVPVSKEEVQALRETDLPIYSILVPVYKEAGVLIALLNALSRLDYPTTKLDILVLMEEDDQETIDAFYHWNPPSHFRGVVVPYGEPKTKPKACNYGLLHSRGDYVVIIDAEDLPEPDQLKKIIVAFSKSQPHVVCIQAKLNYYNSHQNLLTRWFTVEYSMWFDLFLPGLDASNAPIPLGGTSNHFKKEALVEIGAWDPYNVTEDADLGIRLFKRGYKTAIVDSTTFEEANSQLYNWIRQRSRWIKGYTQTWLVHSRQPIRLIREIGLKAFLSFQFVVGGTIFAALMNPIYWILTTIWFLVEWDFIQVIFPGVIYFLGAVCLFLGNFAFTYMNVAGALRRGYYDMVKYALLSPLYWGLASIGAWKGFLQLITQPHYWEKTEHGLTEEKPVINNNDQEAELPPSKQYR